MLKNLILFVLFFVPLLVEGQAALSTKVRKSNIQVSLGAQHSRLIDHAFTDNELLFRGTNFAFRVAYGLQTERSIFNFALTGVVGNLESRSGGWPTEFYVAEAAAEYLKRISSYQISGKENQLFGGIRVSTINQGLVSMRVADNVSIYSMHGIYFALQNRLFFNDKHSLHVSYFLPLVVYNNHVLWNSGANQYTYRDMLNIPELMINNGKMSYVNLFENVQFDINYIKRIGTFTHVEVRYGFIYASSPVEAPIRYYSNRLLVGLKFFL